LRARFLPPLLLALAPLARGQGALAGPDNSFGVWPWLVGNIDPSVPSIVATTANTGLDTLYVHLYRTTGAANGGTLYMVDEAGTWNASWGSIVPYVTLSNLIDEAHAQNLRVIGVVNCFVDPAPLPGDPVHEERLRDVVDYLVHTFAPDGSPLYALDGIVLDRVRYYGGAPSSAPVTSFVASVKDVLGILPLQAFLIASPWYIDGPVYNGNFRTYASAMSLVQADYGQDWEALSPHLEVLLPMAYVAEGGVYGMDTALMGAYTAKVAEFADTSRTLGGSPETRVNVAIRAWNDSTGTTTPASLGSCAQGALAGGGEGFMAFRYFTAVGHPDWFATMAQHSQSLPNRPLAVLEATVAGLTVTLDASGVSDLDEPSASLEVRFDTDGDGDFDTPFSTTKTHTYTAGGAGSFIAGVEVRDSTGLRGARVREVDVLTPLAANAGVLHAGAGGTVVFTLQLGPAAAGTMHVLLGTTSGTSPATSLAPGISLPLVLDAFTYALLAVSNSPLAQNFVGIVPPSGNATASLSVPPGALPPSSIFTLFFFAAVGVDLAQPAYAYATNAVPLVVVP
jgi:hypothetical protein